MYRAPDVGPDVSCASEFGHLSEKETMDLRCTAASMASVESVFVTHDAHPSVASDYGSKFGDGGGVGPDIRLLVLVRVF
jgi:hypothetical protein